jgi:hypothetical protein
MQVFRGRKGEEVQEVEEDNPLEAEAILEVHNRPGQPETDLAREDHRDREAEQEAATIPALKSRLSNNPVTIPM